MKFGEITLEEKPSVIQAKVVLKELPPLQVAPPREQIPINIGGRYEA
jgi:hypothetical protein